MIETGGSEQFLVGFRGAHHELQALLCAFVFLQVMVKLCQKQERRKIGAVRLEQRLQTATGFLVLIGFNQLADGLKMNFVVNVTTFEPKHGALGERAEKPCKIWNQCHDDPDAGGKKEDAGKSLVRKGRTEFEPCSPRATEQNRKQKHLCGPKQAQVLGPGEDQSERDSDGQKIKVDCWAHNYLQPLANPPSTDTALPIKWTLFATDAIAFLTDKLM
jgi:hypothetical protein